MRWRALVGGAVVAAAASLVLPPEHRAGAASYVILVNHGNPASSLTRPELRRVATGVTKQWDNGAVVQLGIIPNDAGETHYLASLLDMSTRELLMRIQEQVFKGELRRPTILRSSSDCVAFIRASPGGLCVAADGEPLPPEVSVVTVR
jgi:hypothetical protein